jgi:hypothetical protein
LSTELQTQIKNAQKKNSDVAESDIDASIKTLQEETRQMIELVEIERTYSAEAVSQFKRVIVNLGSSYNVKEAWSGRADIDRAVLTAQGDICIVHSNGVIQSKPLESISSETLLKILTLAIPEIKRTLQEKRQMTGLRASILERVARELSKVSDESREQTAPPTH